MIETLKCPGDGDGGLAIIGLSERQNDRIAMIFTTASKDLLA